MTTNAADPFTAVIAPMRRCMAPAARVTIWQHPSGTLVIVTAASGTPPCPSETLSADLTLIDQHAAHWGTSGNARRRLIWALITHDYDAPH